MWSRVRVTRIAAAAVVALATAAGAAAQGGDSIATAPELRVQVKQFG